MHSFCDNIFRSLFFLFFFFNDTATTEIYTLSLHDALPISAAGRRCRNSRTPATFPRLTNSNKSSTGRDRKSTRLNSSHSQISYAVFCLKKKKKRNNTKTVDSVKYKTIRYV